MAHANSENLSIVDKQMRELESEGDPRLRSDFSDDEALMAKEKYLGSYKADKYTVIKSHIDVDDTESFLYHTHFIPTEAAIATMVIVHGFGDHSDRHLPVRPKITPCNLFNGLFPKE
jgi:hypothetical protein